MDDPKNTIIKKINLPKLMTPPAPPPRPHTRNFAHLVLILSSAGNPVFKFLGDQEVRIGRHVGDKIRWNNLDMGAYDPNRSISRRHCRLYPQDGKFFLEDLDSRNGTWLNGIRLEPKSPRPVSERQFIQIGQIGFWVFLPNPTP